MYATVAEIQQSFSATVWDPSKHEPLTATVESWIEDWSAALDGQLAGVVTVPVTAVDSPQLYALCQQITRLRVRADVYDAKWADAAGTIGQFRQSVEWRRQADGLLRQILGGGIADGVAAGASVDATPTGSFGTGDTRFGRRDGVW